MPDAPQPTHTYGRTDKPGAWFNHAAVALLPVAACFLGGATQKWAEGIIVALLGLRIIIDPPRVSLGIVANSAIIGLLALTATAFLSSHWFYSPSWRSAIMTDFGIVLPATV